LKTCGEAGDCDSLGIAHREEEELGRQYVDNLITTF